MLSSYLLDTTLALVGLVVTWHDRRRLAPLYLVLGFYAASVVAFYVFARYRYPLVPVLLLFAVAAAAWLLQGARQPQRLMRTPLIVATALVGIIVANWWMLSKSDMRALTYTSLATAYRERGEVETAVALYEDAITLMPDYSPAHSNLASALTAMGAPERAVDHYERAIALEPATGDFYFNYGNALLALERFDEAALNFRRALDVSPDDAEAHNNLGMALGSTGRMREASDAFREALRLDPESALAHRNLAMTLAELGDPRGAQRHRRESERLQERR